MAPVDHPSRAPCASLLAAFVTALCGLSGCAPATMTAPATPTVASGEALLRGFAREFITGRAIGGATLTVLETGQRFQTDAAGRYAFAFPIGARLTLQLTQPGFEPLQTDTVIVPPGGLSGPHDQITFQAVRDPEYLLLQAAIGMRPDAKHCHVATTIAARGKTMDDDRQGEPGARLSIDASVPAFYFGIFHDGPLTDKTNPFVRTLDAASQDGGAALFNLPPRDELYTLTAEKAGLRFSAAKIWCRPGSFINVSPPRGPTVQE